MASFFIGGLERQRIEVTVRGYERAPTGDYHDDNWLRVRVSVSAGGFTGRYDAAFLTAELVSFRDALRNLYSSLNGHAEFATLEEQLHLLLSGNGRGEVSLEGIAMDEAGNRLEFGLKLDQTHLQSTLKELDEVILRFPVRAG
jgi:hypothetical protein